MITVPRRGCCPRAAEIEYGVLLKVQLFNMIDLERLEKDEIHELITLADSIKNNP